MAVALSAFGPVNAQSGGGASAALAALPSTTLGTSGAGYDLTWYTIDNGGGTSVGVGSPGVGQPNPYTLVGTMGQPDAGLLSGNGYTLVGGFWSGAASAYNVYLPVVLKP
jgi:hypothetical protein